jgi:hypothetical protein
MKSYFLSFLILLISGVLFAQIGPSWWQMLPEDWQTNPYKRDTVSILKVEDNFIDQFQSLTELWSGLEAEVIPVNNAVFGACNLLDTNDYSGKVKMFFDSENYYVLYNVNDEDVQWYGSDRVEMHLAPYVDSMNPGRTILPSGYEPAGPTDTVGDYNFWFRWISGEEYVRMSYRGSWSEVGAFFTSWTLESRVNVYPSCPTYTLKEAPEGDYLGDVIMGQPPLPFLSLFEPKTGGYYFLAVMPTELFPNKPDPVDFPAMSIAFKVDDKDDDDIDCTTDDEETDPDRYEAWGGTTSMDAYWAIAFYGAVGIFDFGFTVFPAVRHICPGQSTGSVSLNIKGGNPPYSVLWSTGDTTLSISNLQKGTYWFNVRDNHDNLITDTLLILELELPVAEITDSGGISYHGFTDGWAEAEVSGGTAPYNYQWDDQVNTSLPRAENLTGNSVYHVKVTDHNGCTGIDSVNINDSDKLYVEIHSIKDYLCKDDSDGSLRVVPYYAKWPVTYLWDSPLNTTDSVVTDLSPDVYYRVQIVDADGRSGCDSFKLSKADTIHLDYLFAFDVDSCFGSRTGQIEVNAIVLSGSPLEYSIDSGRTYVSTGYFYFLPAGIYQVLIRDTNKCILRIDSIEISQPDKLQTGSISGKDNVNIWDIEFYSVPGRTGSVYDWIVEGGNIISGQGSNLIGVQWGSVPAGIVSVVETDLIGCSGDAVNLVVSITGLDEQDENNHSQVVTYPNPFSETSIIKFPNPEHRLYSLYISDISGKLCRTVENITTSEYLLEKGSLKDGLYFIELKGPKIFRGKIIIE